MGYNVSIATVCVRTCGVLGRCHIDVYVEVRFLFRLRLGEYLVPTNESLLGLLRTSGSYTGGRGHGAVRSGRPGGGVLRGRGGTGEVGTICGLVDRCRQRHVGANGDTTQTLVEFADGVVGAGQVGDQRRVAKAESGVLQLRVVLQDDIDGSVDTIVAGELGSDGLVVGDVGDGVVSSRVTTKDDGLDVSSGQGDTEVRLEVIKQGGRAQRRVGSRVVSDGRRVGKLR